MAEETSIPNELKELFAKYEEIKVGILSRYTQLVSAVLNGEITDENDMEDIMDGLLDYGDDERFLSLYKKICRHIYYEHPKLVGEHVNLYRMIFEEKEDA